jgi:NADH-quinone oxidoreductase subunit M
VIQVLLWLPLAVALACFVVPSRLVGPWATGGALVTLALGIGILAGFDTGDPGLQHVVDEAWIPDLGVRYELGVDGISIFLILLTALLWAAGTAFSMLRGTERPRVYFFMLGLAETATLGAFLAQDLLLFVLFFDLMLIPFFFLIGAWGSGDSVAATIKMMVYTLFGSLLMLVGAIATAILASDSVGQLSFSLADLEANLLPEGSQDWIFWFFAAAFLVKMPAFLVHGWMPDAYRAAPLPVLALLSGVLSKVGAYGFLRVVLPIYPDASVQFDEILLMIGLTSILYGSVMAFTQTNVRLIAGFSSVAQLGFITIGIFSLRPDGADGAVLQMVNHGLVVAPTFIIIALLAERSGTEDLRRMGGLAFRAPILAVMFLIVTMATLAIPGSANFIGEFFILNGVFQAKIVYALIAAVGVALAAFYALRLYQRTMHNRLPEGMESREISLRDGLVLGPLVACIVALALHPGFVLERSDPSAERAVTDARAAEDQPPGRGEDLAGRGDHYPVVFTASDSDQGDPRGDGP